ncbi:MAG: diaminopimelate epimerase [Candidatus Omnitrophota bacterium]
MDKLYFVKMVASGNDFVIIEKPLPSNAGDLSNLAKEICERKYGIGADGLLVLEKSKIADFRMRIFNPDGSEAEMCGNGLRCAAFWTNYKSTYNKPQKPLKKIKVETKAGILEARVNKNRVKIKMTEPKDFKMDINLNIGGEKYTVHHINTGVPHTILFVNNLKNTNVKGLGKIIRFHPRFLPQGTNVDFVEIKDRKNIILRTYERGVEDETLACGTGAVASAIITMARLPCRTHAEYSVNVLTQSGEILKVYFERDKDRFKNVWLEGTARMVFSGVYYRREKSTRNSLQRKS